MLRDLVGGVYWCIKPSILNDDAGQTAPLEPYKGMLVKIVAHIYRLTPVPQTVGANNLHNQISIWDEDDLYPDRASANKAFLKAQTEHIQSLSLQLDTESTRLLDFIIKATNVNSN